MEKAEPELYPSSYDQNIVEKRMASEEPNTPTSHSKRTKLTHDGHRGPDIEHPPKIRVVPFKEKVE